MRESLNLPGSYAVSIKYVEVTHIMIHSFEGRHGFFEPLQYPDIPSLIARFKVKSLMSVRQDLEVCLTYPFRGSTAAVGGRGARHPQREPDQETVDDPRTIAENRLTLRSRTRSCSFRQASRQASVKSGGGEDGYAEAVALQYEAKALSTMADHLRGHIGLQSRTMSSCRKDPGDEDKWNRNSIALRRLATTTADALHRVQAKCRQITTDGASAIAAMQLRNLDRNGNLWLSPESIKRDSIAQSGVQQWPASGSSGLLLPPPHTVPGNPNAATQHKVQPVPRQKSCFGGAPPPAAAEADGRPTTLASDVCDHERDGKLPSTNQSPVPKATRKPQQLQQPDRLMSAGDALPPPTSAPPTPAGGRRDHWNCVGLARDELKQVKTALVSRGSLNEFFVREKSNGQHALTVRGEGVEIKLYVVTKPAGSGFCIRACPGSFATLGALIDHYCGAIRPELGFQLVPPGGYLRGRLDDGIEAASTPPPQGPGVPAPHGNLEGAPPPTSSLGIPGQHTEVMMAMPSPPHGLTAGTHDDLAGLEAQLPVPCTPMHDSSMHASADRLQSAPSGPLHERPALPVGPSTGNVLSNAPALTPEQRPPVPVDDLGVDRRTPPRPPPRRGSSASLVSRPARADSLFSTDPQASVYDVLEFVDADAQASVTSPPPPPPPPQEGSPRHSEGRHPDMVGVQPVSFIGDSDYELTGAAPEMFMPPGRFSDTFEPLDQLWPLSPVHENAPIDAPPPLPMGPKSLRLLSLPTMSSTSSIYSDPGEAVAPLLPLSQASTPHMSLELERRPQIPNLQSPVADLQLAGLSETDQLDRLLDQLSITAGALSRAAPVYAPMARVICIETMQKIWTGTKGASAAVWLLVDSAIDGELTEEELMHAVEATTLLDSVLWSLMKLRQGAHIGPEMVKSAQDLVTNFFLLMNLIEDATVDQLPVNAEDTLQATEIYVAETTQLLKALHSRTQIDALC